MKVVTAREMREIVRTEMSSFFTHSKNATSSNQRRNWILLFKEFQTLKLKLKTIALWIMSSK